MVTTATKPASKPFDAKAALQAVEPTDDVLDYAMRCVLALAPNLSAEIVKAAEKATRQMYRGERFTVVGLDGEIRSERNAQIRRDYQRGERVPLLIRRYSLSRAQILRILAE